MCGLVTRVIVSLLTLSLLLVCGQEEGSCQPPTTDKDSGGSCSFEKSVCGWNNTADNGHLLWQREDRSFFGQNSYIRLNMSAISTGNDANLYSPWLCATGSGALGSFTFRYSLEKGGNCGLAVYVMTSTLTTPAWRTMEGTGFSFSEPVDTIYVKCSLLPFQIVIVGQKLTNGTCGTQYDEIAIDDIIYSNTNATSSSYHDCSTLPNALFSTTAESQTSAEVVSGSATDQTHPQTSEDDDDSATIAGVLFGVIALIVVAVTVAYILWRKRQKEKEEEEGRDQEPPKESSAMTNETYMTGSAVEMS